MCILLLLARVRIEELEKEKRAVAKTIDDGAAAKKKEADEGKEAIALLVVVLGRMLRVLSCRMHVFVCLRKRMRESACINAGDQDVLLLIHDVLFRLSGGRCCQALQASWSRYMYREMT